MTASPDSILRWGSLRLCHLSSSNITGSVLGAATFVPPAVYFPYWETKASLSVCRTIFKICGTVHHLPDLAPSRAVVKKIPGGTCHRGLPLPSDPFTSIWTGRTAPKSGAHTVLPCPWLRL